MWGMGCGTTVIVCRNVFKSVRSSNISIFQSHFVSRVGGRETADMGGTTGSSVLALLFLLLVAPSSSSHFQEEEEEEEDPLSTLLSPKCTNLAFGLSREDAEVRLVKSLDLLST